ncbi:hypothetical protein [Plantactinospora endophytica]|uniref:Uncharacterized protein n=1 Tax=Plantactinospora endophytica TaxID=673535 RepID=A0ABQ4ECT0_9ACTN|nr:hypothetical protein [Plantactinospora endophytica]GIG92545.1 hypothetical protein Pen02_74810 [Plantactinospora endophytica]
MAGSHPRALVAAIVVSGLGLAGTLVAGPTAGSLTATGSATSDKPRHSAARLAVPVVAAPECALFRRNGDPARTARRQ